MILLLKKESKIQSIMILKDSQILYWNQLLTLGLLLMSLKQKRIMKMKNV